MRQQNHASPKRGISKMKSQGSTPEVHKTLQSQIRPYAHNRLSIRALAVVHGRLTSHAISERLLPASQQPQYLDLALRQDGFRQIQAYRTGFTLAEWLRRKADRVDPERVFGPHHCLGEKHLRRILKSYADYYNGVRTHRSLNKDAPAVRLVQRTGSIKSHPILGGLRHHHVRV
jgi:hypothetical protein